MGGRGGRVVGVRLEMEENLVEEWKNHQVMQMPGGSSLRFMLFRDLGISDPPEQGSKFMATLTANDDNKRLIAEV